MAHDYSKYGLTYQNETPVTSYGESYGETPGSPAGFTDAAGNFYTETQAESLVGSITKGNYVDAGGNPDMYIDPARAAGDARGTYAQLTRNMYDEWQKTFQPLETDLLSKTTYNGNPGVMNGIIADQTEKINSNFDNARAVFQRKAASYGMTLTPEQQEANDSEMALDRSLALVDMNNRARMYQGDLNRQILGAGASAGLTSALSPK